MKRIIFKTSIAFLLLFMMGAGCKNEYEKFVQIDPLVPDAQISSQLNSAFSKDNNCLLSFREDTVYHVISTRKELAEIDNCTSIPDIDFDKHTLIVGKVMVTGMVSSISEVSLSYNSADDIYLIEVSIDDCEECYTAIGQLYFWRVYPKLKSGSSFKLLVTNY
jgi:hypothetical protein